MTFDRDGYPIADAWMNCPACGCGPNEDHKRTCDRRLPPYRRYVPKLKGRQKGGAARAAALSPARRSEIASHAARARWGNGS